MTVVSNEVKFRTHDLKNWADGIALDVSRMEGLIGQLGEIVRRTGSYWTGEAGDQYRNSYFEQEETRQEILRRINEDPNKLTQIAEVFDTATKAAAQIAVGLPADICGNGSGYGGGRGF